MGRKTRTILITLNVICLLILIIFAPLAMYLFSMPSYMSLYKEHNVTENIAEDDLVSITANLISFFQNKEEVQRFEPEGDAPAFTAAERSHLEDVRDVTNMLLSLFYASLILFVLFTILLLSRDMVKFFRSMGVVFVAAASGVMVILLLLYILSRNFWVFFEQFHQVFFPQGNYMFPGDSLLITLFPLGFFYSYFLRMVTASGVILAVLLVVGIVFLNINKLRELKETGWKK
ncbi:MAG: DUF1461 domain-containing protein [Actinomycetota bacterium]